jgi:hypothetical protein
MGLTAMMLLAATAAPAAAQGPELIYRWPTDEPVHYRIQTYVHAPRAGMWFYAAENDDARVAEFTMGLLVKCRQVDVQKKAVEVHCDIHRAQLGGAAADPSEQDELLRIFSEYVGVLDDSQIQMVIGNEGRIKTFDLEGPTKNTERENDRFEDLRMILMRSMSALEIELPKSGEDPGVAWKQKGAPLAMRLLSHYGTAGAVRMKHQVVGRDGELLNIETEATGMVSPAMGSSSVEEETLSPTDTSITVSMVASGKSTFDPALGLFRTAEMSVNGTLTTASSGLGDGLYLNQFTLAEWMENFDQLDAEFEAALKASQE